MSCTIFAICCHILFYSRSASALRIAVDDYALKCDEKAGVIGSASKTKYVCKTLCKDGATGVLDGKAGNLEKCVGLIANKIKFVSFDDNKNECKKYENSFTAVATKQCQNGNLKFYAPQGSVFGDPHVVNMAGEKFDILTTGTFSLLSLTTATEEDLAINGTVVRFGTKCGQSFIDDLELSGGWIREFYNTKTLKVRAVQDTRQTEALQVNFGQKWQPLADLQDMARVKKTADAIQLDLSKLTVEVGAGKHKHHGWNFVNLDVQGLATLDDSIRVGGLLGYDDHTQVLHADADCATFASAAETDMQAQQSCLSYLSAN